MPKYTSISLKTAIIILFVAVLSWSCNNDETAPIVENELEASLITDVLYGISNQETYDIYLPKNRDASTKILVIVHGGSWVSGDKSDLNEIFDEIISRLPNYAVANINYQLAGIGKSPFPMQLLDMENALNDISEKATSYNLSTQFGLIGFSAGAHLSMLYSYDFNELHQIDMVCSVVGPANFTDIHYTQNPDFELHAQGLQLITGILFEGNVSYYESVSPYHVINSSAPPSILFYGGQDELIPTSQGFDMHQKLVDLDITNQFVFYENEGHGWEGEALTDTQNKLEAFILQNF